MINILFSRICILMCGTLYPGYVSFKTVRAKNVEDYVIWMMYWIVFALFKVSETFGDIFLTWFPFYYEFKVVLIIWLLPTIGNGSSFIYKNCVHPLLKKHETRLDHHLDQVKEKGQDMVLHYMKEAALYISRTIMNAINKNFPNTVLSLLANNDTYVSGRSTQHVIEAVVDEQVDKRAVSRKNSTKTIKNKDSAEARITQGRTRKSRQVKQEINHNLNES